MNTVWFIELLVKGQKNTSKLPSAAITIELFWHLEEPLNWIRFTLANLILAWAAVRYGGQHIHLPNDLPLRIDFAGPVLLLATVFSVVAPLSLSFCPGPRALRTLAAIVFCVPLAGALWAAATPFMEPLAGAQLAFLTAWNSPVMAVAAALWAWLWAGRSFPAGPPSPTGEPKEPRQPAVVEPASDWIGSSR